MIVVVKSGLLPLPNLRDPQEVSYVTYSHTPIEEQLSIGSVNSQAPSDNNQQASPDDMQSDRDIIQNEPIGSVQPLEATLSAYEQWQKRMKEIAIAEQRQAALRISRKREKSCFRAFALLGTFSLGVAAGMIICGDYMMGAWVAMVSVAWIFLSVTFKRCCFQRQSESILTEMSDIDLNKTEVMAVRS
jgi:hypothetical protein